MDLTAVQNWSFQAQALAEKSMRDILAQKEQAERNVTTYNKFTFSE